MSRSISGHTSSRTQLGSRVADGQTGTQASGRVDAAVVPRRCTLDGFIEAVSQADGIDLTDVDAFTTLVVRTENSIYQVTILKPHAREVLVQGARSFRCARQPV